MAKHRDANTDTELEGRSDFIRDNAESLVRELEKKCVRYTGILNKQGKTIASLKRALSDRKKQSLTMKVEPGTRFLRFHQVQSIEQFINVNNIESAAFLDNGSDNHVLLIKIKEDDPAFPEHDTITINGQEAHIATELLRELSVPLQVRENQCLHHS